MQRKLIRRYICKINTKIYFTICSCISRASFKFNGVEINGKLTTYGPVRVSNAEQGTIRIGDRTTINSCWYINKSGGGQERTSLVTQGNGTIIIGNSVGISNTTIFSAQLVEIEDNVMIGVNNVISDTDHHSVFFSDRINGNVNVKTAPVIIKKGAWIGGHCVILKGVTIGERSVIGAGSVVTKSVPNNEVWAGNPAKFIKKI